MIRISRSRSSPRTGRRILLVSAAIAVIGLLPLLLHLMLSPSRGDPAGLVLLAIGAALAALVGSGVGSRRSLLQRLLNRE